MWWGAQELGSPAVAAGLVLAADLVLTGMLHMDGLVDSADGLLPQVPRAKRLAIMAEPTVGAYGVVVAVVVVLLRFAALASLDADVLRSEEQTSELQSLMRISYAVFCLKKKKEDQPSCISQ